MAGVSCQFESRRGAYSLAGSLLEDPAEQWFTAGSRGGDPAGERSIRQKINTFRFAEYMEKLVDLLRRVTTVSVGTMEVVMEMATR